MQKYSPVTCHRCGIKFIPNGSRHFYCGTRKEKSGCAWLVYQEQAKKAKEKYYEANKSLVKQRVAEWQKAHPQKVCEYGSQNRERYREYHQIRRREYKSRNRGKVNAGTAKRFAAKLMATPKWVNLKAIRKIYEQACAMSLQTGIPHHVDHIIPLRSKTVCGLHVEWNLQILDALSNTKKLNKYQQEDALAF
jgi:hypothetical protein